ncbi:hypothetical protein [Baekduia sp. Peel2402]|uniref:hypothetical protein n=1 Tax=Baekduia sp. Peel2402 TaxID=3458296 RepID=UPI00403E4C0E
MKDISAGLLLSEIGLAALKPREAQIAYGLLMEILQLRLGSRVAQILGPNWADDFARVTGLDRNKGLNAEGERRGLELLEQTLPEYGLYVEEELERLKLEFVERLRAALGEGETL